MELTVQTREKFGATASKAARKEGLIPAELYGHGITNGHFSVAAKDFTKAFKEAGTSTVLYLLIDGEKGSPAKKQEKKPAIIHSVAHDPLTGDIAHVDFYAVRMDEMITAKIPLKFVNEAPAVREKAAIINKSMAEIEVEALPQDLPHEFTIDLSMLDDLDKSIYVRDIKVPKGVKLLVEGDTAIATATPPLAEEVVEAAPADIDITDVKVEGEEKKAEREKQNAEKN